MQTFVEDPIIALKGTLPRIDRAVALIVLLWRGLGFNLSFGKAERGTSVDCIGALLAVAGATRSQAPSTSRCWKRSPSSRRVS